MKRNTLMIIAFIVTLVHLQPLSAKITWQQKQSFGHDRGRPGTVEVNGKVYLVGGGDPNTGSYDFRKVEMYDPNTNTWSDKADMPRGKAGNFGLVAANGKIYALGGEGPYAGRWSPEVYEYNPTADSWAQKNDWANRRRDFGFTELNGKIYIAGGSPNYSSFSNKFERYDPTNDTWTSLATLPGYLSGSPLAAVAGKIYLVGTREKSGVSETWRNWVYQYNPNNNSWTQKNSMPGNRKNPSVAVYDNKIYLIGGFDNNNNYIAEIWEYDPATDSWAMVSSINFRKTINNHFHAPVIGNKVFFVGTRDFGSSNWIRNLQEGTFDPPQSGGLNLTFNQINASNFPVIESYVTVTDDQGNPLTNLTASNFIVKEDGFTESPITVTRLGGGSEPISVALVIDRSGSMGGQDLQNAKNAATNFVNQMSTNDRAAVISFDSNVTVNQSFTTDKAQLINAINSLNAGGGTAIYDAIITSVNEINAQTGRKAILLMTDGADGSSSNTLQQAINAAVQASVPVYTIGLGLSQGSSIEQNLKKIANDTGGRYYYAPNSSDLQQLYQLISRQLQNQYKITYTTHNSNRDGSTRIVQITANFQGNSDTKTKTYKAPINGGQVPVFPHAANNQAAGSEFWLDIKVGTAANPVTSLFGLSFVLNYTRTNDIDVVTPLSSNVIPGSFMGNDLVFFPDVDESSGKVSVGISRKAGQGGVSGYGTVVSIKFKVNTSAPHGTQIHFTLSDLQANNSSGAPLSLNPSSLTITINSFVVWPGDTDNNRQVNQADVLPIGLYWQRTGPSRTQGGCTWSAQPAQPWSNRNATYADCNGDGTVNQADVLCIGLNWNRAHNINLTKIENSSNSENLNILTPEKLELVINGNSDPGQEFFIDVYARDVSNLFGISFELVYAPITFIKPSLAEIGTANLLGTDLIFFPNMDKSNGKISIGISRKAGQGGVTGSGLITRVTVKMSANAIIGQSITTLSIQNVQANDPEGNAIEFVLSQVTNVSLVTDIEPKEHQNIPLDFTLFQNYPNPFNPETEIRFQLPKASNIIISIYNTIGQVIRNLVSEQYDAGHHSVRWDGKDNSGNEVSSGIYLYQIQAGEFAKVMKMSLIR